MNPFKAARQWACLSLRKASALSGVPLRTLCRYENGDMKRYDMAVANALAAAYGLTIGQVTGTAPLPPAKKGNGDAA
jgi:transcriptional regulator with XRE-family HTH domain